MHSFSGDEAGVGCSGCSGWNRSTACREVLVGIDARFVCEAEGKIVGSILFIVVLYILHVRHGVTVTQLRRNHSQHLENFVSRAATFSHLNNYSGQEKCINYYIFHVKMSEASAFLCFISFFGCFVYVLFWVTKQDITLDLGCTFSLLSDIL